eukprot:scaffold25834_cov21-Tisochrysis_lutea.AAC.2
MQPQHLPWRNNHHTFWTMVGRTAQIKLGTQTSTLEVCKAVYTNSHNNLRHGAPGIHNPHHEALSHEYLEEWLHSHALLGAHKEYPGQEIYQKDL